MEPPTSSTCRVELCNPPSRTPEASARDRPNMPKDATDDVALSRRVGHTGSYRIWAVITRGTGLTRVDTRPLGSGYGGSHSHCRASRLGSGTPLPRSVVFVRNCDVLNSRVSSHHSRQSLQSTARGRSRSVQPDALPNFDYPMSSNVTNLFDPEMDGIQSAVSEHFVAALTEFIFQKTRQSQQQQLRRDQFRTISGIDC